MSANHSKEVVRLTGRIVHQTTKAILFHVSTEHHEIEGPVNISENNKTGFWFPFSQVKEIHSTAATNMDTNTANLYDELVVTKWIAKQKGVE